MRKHLFVLVAAILGLLPLVSHAQDCTSSLSVPQFYNFDSVSAGSLPPCWTAVQTGTSSSGTFPSVYAWAPNARSGDNYFEFESSNGQTEILKMPYFDASNPIMLSFYGYSYSSSYAANYFIVGYYEYDGTDFIALDTITLPVGSYPSEPIEVFFNEVTESEFAPAIKVVKSSGQYTIFIDDLTVQEIPSCPNPTNIYAYNVLATEANLTWTPHGNESNWNVAYSTELITDFDNANYSSESSNDITLTGLTANTQYFAYVQSDCGGGDYGNWMGPISFTTNPCDDGCYYHVDMVDSYGDGWNGGYIYYALDSTLQGYHMGLASGSAATDSFFVCQGMNIQLFWQSGSYDGEVSFAVKNAFDELLYQGTGSSLSAGVAFWNGIASCSSDCPSPNQLVVSNPTVSTIDLEWNERGDATSWNVYASTTPVTDFSNIQPISTSSNPYTFTGLDSLTTYYLYVQADCGSEGSNWSSAIGQTSLCENPCNIIVSRTSNNSYEWDYAYIVVAQSGHTLGEFGGVGSDQVLVCPGDSISFTFDHMYDFYDYACAWTIYDAYSNPLIERPSGEYGVTYKILTDCTAPTCPRPLQLAVAGTADGSVSLTWNEMGEAYAWNVAYGTEPMDATASNMTFYPVTDTTFAEITGLIDTTYYFYVQADCGGEYSDWTGPVTARPNTFDLPANFNGTISMCNGWIYDDGGINGNYANNLNSTVTIYAVDTTMGVAINGTQWTESGNYDYIIIYDGPNTNSPVVFSSQGWPSSSSNGATVSAFSTHGPLTLYFHTDVSGQYRGFELNVTCFDMSCPAVDSLAVTYVSSDSIALSWAGNDVATQYIVKYADHQFDFADAVDSVFVNTTEAVFTNLNSNTVYYFAVASDCGVYSNPQTISQRTNCAPIANVPFTEGFEGQETYTSPLCWTIIAGTQTGYGSDYPYVYGYTSHTGSNSLYLYTSTYYNSNENIIAMPAMEGLDTLQVSFWAFASSYDAPDTVQVGVIEQGSTFVPVANFTVSSSWEQYTAFLTSYTGTGNQIAFRTKTNQSSSSLYIDDIEVTAAPDCLPVQNVVATATSSTEVELTWTNNGSTAWNVYYSTTPVTDFSGVNATAVTTNPYTVTGLTAGTQYYFYVQADCGAGTTAPWAGSNAEQTLRCDDGCELFFVMENEYSDGWNGASIGVYAGTALIGTATVPTSSSNYIQSVLMCAGDSISLQWNTGSWDEECSFSVVDAYDTELYSCTDGSTLSGEFFTMVANCTPVTCDRPADLTASNITSSNATLTWTSDAAEFIVTVSAGSTTDSYVATTNTYNVAGLSPMTSYTWTVTAICAPGDTSRTATSTFMTTLCDNPVIAFNYDTTTEATTQQQGPGYSYYNYSYSQQIIDSAYMAAMNGSDVTGFAFNVAVATAGDRFNNCEVWMANVDKSSFTDQDDWVILSDSNATLVYSGSLNFSETGWNTFGFNTPFTWDGHSNVILAVNRGQNQYLMGAYWYAHETTENKHIIAYQDDAALDMSNPPYSYGAAHNYTYDVQLISCGAGCGTPSVSVTNYDYGQATIAWSGSADNYEVAIKMANDANWPAETAVNNANTYTFTNLQPATTYNVRVRQICDAAEGLISSWGVATFTTDSLPCFAPEALEATAVQGQQATLAWTAGGNENAWNLHVFNTTFDQTYQASATTYTVTGLTAGVTYYAAVSAVCGNGIVMSDYSDTISFTTVVCDPVTNVAVSGITNNSATITWTAGANNTGSWEVAWNYHGAGMAQPLGSQVVQATSFTINGLSASTPYDVAVRALCGQNYNSTYAESQFTTLEGQGIDRVDDGLNLAIFPNPASSNATITLSGVNGKVNVAVVDMSGRTVFNTTMECNGDCEKKLNVENLASGAYFVRVYGENVNAVKRLVVK